MTLDYTKLLKKLDKDPSGEDPGLRLRTAVVDTVNGDGTVDIILSGGLVPDVPVLDGAVISDGAVVQVLVARGSILVLGGSDAGSSGKVEALAPNNVQTTNTSYTVFSGGDLHGAAFVAPGSGAVKITVMGWLTVFHSAVAVRAYMGAQVRAGAVINSGTVFSAVADARAAIAQNDLINTFDYRYVSISHIVSGLTPGADYNAVTAIKANTFGTATAQERRMLIEPW